MRSLAETAALVVERHQALDHDDLLIDAVTASAITAVYNGLSHDNRRKFDSLDPYRAIQIVWRLVS